MKISRLIVVVTCSLLASVGCSNSQSASNSHLESNETSPGSLPATTEVEKIPPLDVEPNYTRQPLYALLAADIAAEEKRWLVLDGDTIFLDRNANGDLTEVDEKIDGPLSNDTSIGERSRIELGNIAVGTFVLDLSVDQLKARIATDLANMVDERLANGWRLVSLKRIDNQDQRDIPVWLAPDKKSVVATHLKGPLQFGRVTDDASLSRSSATKFDVKIGVSELLDATTGRKIFPVLLTRDVPDQLAPQATFNFPHKDPNQEPISRVVSLDQRC